MSYIDEALKSGRMTPSQLAALVDIFGEDEIEQWLSQPHGPEEALKVLKAFKGEDADKDYGKPGGEYARPGKEDYGYGVKP